MGGQVLRVESGEWRSCMAWLGFNSRRTVKELPFSGGKVIKCWISTTNWREWRPVSLDIDSAGLDLALGPASGSMNGQFESKPSLKKIDQSELEVCI